MCLSIRDIENSKDFSLFRKEKDKLVAWKVFYKYNNSLLSYYREAKAKQKYISNRYIGRTKQVDPGIILFEENREEIHNGIHVYLKKPNAQDYSYDSIVIKCLCDKSDLVSVGYFGIRIDKPNSAVFNRVELVPPKGYCVNSKGFIVKKKKQRNKK